LRPIEERAGSPGLWVAGGLRRKHHCWEEEMLRLFEREPAEGRGPVCLVLSSAKKIERPTRHGRGGRPLF